MDDVIEIYIRKKREGKKLWTDLTITATSRLDLVFRFDRITISWEFEKGTWIERAYWDWEDQERARRWLNFESFINFWNPDYFFSFLFFERKYTSRADYSHITIVSINPILMTTDRFRWVIKGLSVFDGIRIPIRWKIVRNRIIYQIIITMILFVNRLMLIIGNGFH